MQAAMELETEGGDDGHIDASSLATVLTQALRSEDRGLLERCVLPPTNCRLVLCTQRAMMRLSQRSSVRVGLAGGRL